MVQSFEEWKNIFGALTALAVIVIVSGVVFTAFLSPAEKNVQGRATSSTGLLAAGIAAQGFTQTLTDQQNGITVSATPKSVQSGGIAFSVSLDNHKISLNEYLELVQLVFKQLVKPLLKMDILSLK